MNHFCQCIFIFVYSVYVLSINPTYPFILQCYIDQYYMITINYMQAHNMTELAILDVRIAHYV